VSTLEETAAGVREALPGSEVGLEPETEVMTINIGPHHPATHGVLRLVVQL
jgi:hypothetical protein